MSFHTRFPYSLYDIDLLLFICVGIVSFHTTTKASVWSQNRKSLKWLSSGCQVVVDVINITWRWIITVVSRDGESYGFFPPLLSASSARHLVSNTDATRDDGYVLKRANERRHRILDRSRDAAPSFVKCAISNQRLFF